MNKKECLRRKRSSKRESIRVGGGGVGGVGGGVGSVGGVSGVGGVGGVGGGGGGGGVGVGGGGPAGDGGGLGGQQISMPTKLTQLRYSGYSAEFLDRVEPNGNIPGKNGTAGIAGMYYY